ncbi:MAG: DUF3450 domain-containing protein [Gammaproteobacteria bacterium]|nr:DUF3450 domain-containing protein [Gammaproteobacteria bacterium]
MTHKWIAPCLVLLAGIFHSGNSSSADAPEKALQDAIRMQENSNQAAARSQQTINQLSEQTNELYNEYRYVLNQTQSLKIYNGNLEQLIESQTQELNSYQTQFGRLDDTQRDIVPLMIKMVDTLEEFIQLDQPFLLGERQSRVAELKILLSRSDVATSEKYRRIMEAYQVEMEYGRTIEAYRDILESNGEKRTVDFLRMGRVALFYQSLDEKETGMWDKSSQKWTALSSDYRLAVSKGLGIARKQAAPDLLIVPVTAPEQAK